MVSVFSDRILSSTVLLYSTDLGECNGKRFKPDCETGHQIILDSWATLGQKGKKTEDDIISCFTQLPIVNKVRQLNSRFSFNQGLEAVVHGQLDIITVGSHSEERLTTETEWKRKHHPSSACPSVLKTSTRVQLLKILPPPMVPGWGLIFSICAFRDTEDQNIPEGLSKPLTLATTQLQESMTWREKL